MDVVADERSSSNREETTLDEDTIFDLLGNERRRACLKRLQTAEGERPVRDLAREVADDVVDASTSPEDIHNSVYISLCQSHLPKLHTANIVEYDSEAKTVSRGSTFDQIEPYLETRTSTQEHWKYIIGASAVTALLLIAVFVGGPLVSIYVIPILLVLHVLLVAVGVRNLLAD